jgi:NAD dependent epimerase/dehydratase family enzyme
MADVLGVINFLEGRPNLTGVINVSSPNPTDNRGFMATLRTVVRAPFGMPLQRWMLELGSALIRTETELVLKSRWVLPERLLAEGYEFEYPELHAALQDAVSSRQS